MFSYVVVVSDLNKNFGGSTDLEEKGTDRRICIPLFTPLIQEVSGVYTSPFSDTDISGRVGVLPRGVGALMTSQCPKGLTSSKMMT